MNALRWRWHRIRGGWRCVVNIHRLRGYEDCGDGINVAPFNPYGKPGPNCWRVCDWCGARWRGAYDGIAPFWQRVHRPAVSVPVPPPNK